MGDQVKIVSGMDNEIVVNDKITISVEKCDVVKDKTDIKCCTIGWQLWLDGGLSGAFKRIAADEGKTLQHAFGQILNQHKSSESGFSGKQ